MEDILRLVSLVVLGLVGVIAGIAQGLFKCILSYFKGFSYSFNKKYSLKTKAELDEPSVEKYFFYKQYEDLLNTYRSAKSINIGYILVLKQQLTEDSYFTLSRVKTAQVAIQIVGTLVNIMCFSIHFLIITVISIPIYLYYSIVISVERIRFIKGKIAGVCSHCHSKFNIPYYICPSCGEIHKMLIPGPYGIIKRKCKCGKVLPCTNSTGRFRLKAICPVCSKDIESRESSPICIPIVGGKFVGKTSFMYSTINALIEDISKEKKWNIRFLNQKLEEEMEKHLVLFKKGIPPEKTSKTDMDVYNVFINSDKFSSEKLLYMYDIAGEYFDLRTNIRRQNYYKYIHGLIFIIDPLSIACGEKDIKVKDQYKNSNSSDTNVDDLIDRFILGLREIKQIKLNKLIDVPVAVIVNKMDLFNYNGNVIDFLREMGEDKVIRKFEHNFANYEFFSCSVLENTDNEETYKAKEVAEPINWILSQANNELK
ncbi:TRAFAC clade GTPase domain-containing protein [Clostridium sp. DJ247]|uniref:TRAFAC clade GTPase domain-containing protein n=1 Tax=Clostridium sp. DJ247 TaxID=2726188 RepID=UPI001F4CB28C|nr:hypothetical protein [Clostridium sp. DJ247]